MSSPQTGVQEELSRDLNLFHITMMGLGMMIGAGVFVGIGMCSHSSGGGGLMVTFALNGLIALFSALSFAELASAIPRAGGTYNFARIAFGRPASFIAGWMEWLAASAAGGFYALVLMQTVFKFCVEFEWIDSVADGGWMGMDWRVRVFALGAVLVFVLINFRGSSETGKLGAIFTVGQMLFVVAIGIAGAVQFFLDPSRIENFQPFLGSGDWIGLLGTMGVIYVAFEGFEVIAQAGDETIDPRRNIPKAILYSVLIVTLTYLLVAFGTLVGLSMSDTDPATGQTLSQATNGAGENVAAWIGSHGHEGDSGFQAAVSVLLKGWGGLLVTLAVIFSATSALNATIYSATRAGYALGRDRMLPKAFSNIHPVTKTPWFSLLCTAGLILGVAAMLMIKDAGATASIMFLMLFLLVNVCVIRVRRHMGDELQYGFLMPLFPLFPILAILLQLGLAFGIFEESIVAWFVGVGWLVAGVGIFLFYSRSRAIQTEEEIHVFHEERHKQATAKGYNVMVALANPENALQLAQVTHRLCRPRKDTHVELIHMVPVPAQTPLDAAEEFMWAGREAIMESMLYLAMQNPISTTIRYCRSAARGIVTAVRQKKIKLLILGWHGKKSHSHFTIGSTVDPVMETAPCNILTLKNCGQNRKFKRILVPLAGGPNSRFTLETAAILASHDGGTVDILTVDTGRASKFDAEAFLAMHQSKLPIDPHAVSARKVPGSNIVETILDTAEEYDLVVMGNTHESRLQRMTHTPIPETIAERCDKPFIMCRSAKGIRRWLRRFI
ncbi:MAG: amino acid permease [Phycisphaerales bacterium]|jgi:basic amino acid/polyamine antiporter, APA family|nr:amino acid permease [Phycisphaerales bacterium]